MLKITEPGRSDHDLLKNLNYCLDALIDLEMKVKGLRPKEKLEMPMAKTITLLYTPLSGKHLEVTDIRMIKLDFLKKESLILFPNSVNVKNIWLNELSNTIKIGLPSSPYLGGNTLNNIHNLRSRTPEPLRYSGGKEYPGDIQTVYQTQSCSVDYWINESWKSFAENCTVEVRITTTMVGCWSIILQKSNRMVLNSWIYLYTTIHRDSSTQISISCKMDQNKEYYRINCPCSYDSDQLFQHLIDARKLLIQKRSNTPTQEFLISRSSSLQKNDQGLISRTFSLPTLKQQKINQKISKKSEQTFKLLLECKVKIFSQKDHGKWTNLGWGIMKLIMELPFHEIRINIGNEKQIKLIDSIVSSDGVERLNKTNIAMTLNNFNSGLKNIYMIQLKDESTTTTNSKYENLNHQAMIDGIPVTYILEKLHQLGTRYFGDKSTAFAELHVEGIDKPFWVHEEYLVLQSLFFREVFENVSNGDIITITVPSPDTFEPLLEFLYSGDADKWYDTLTVDNYYDVWQNLEYLGLGPAAQACGGEK
ncbi:9674_t:CDS:2 [Diversispora eburnea]|uniref:9674_t:CDS:1 n=1 Tax=Diversispora eburnea TaxID=1213867 RepID=A0A9N8W2Y7_9GLOM|nr:9674_t:CDS:2 [Diversispora eburnea]